MRQMRAVGKCWTCLVLLTTLSCLDAVVLPTALELFRLVDVEMELLELMRQYIQLTEETLQRLQRYQQIFSKSELYENGENIIRHFASINHFVAARRQLEGDIYESVFGESSIHDSLPLLEQYTAISNVLLRMTSFYNRTDLLDEIKSTDGRTLVEEMADEESDVEMPSENFRALCAMNDTYSKDVFPVATNFNCFYTIPQFDYARYKTETILHDPHISLFREVISPKEIAVLKQAALPKLEPSVVQDASGRQFPSQHRIAKSHSLNDSLSGLVAKLDTRLSRLTRLSLGGSENLWITNYPIGGEYKLHCDFLFKENNSELNDRIATALIYLTNVTIGGATVFPEIGVSAKPQEGSLVLFYNLLRDGSPDYRTRHASCPVLWGDKWIANKWFGENSQFTIRPCPAN